MEVNLLAAACEASYNEHTYQNKDYDAEALKINIEGCQIIAFRGTEASTALINNGWMDIITDMRILPWYSSNLKSWLHAGFLKSTRSIADTIVKDLTRAKPLYITGHSLGGAMACVFAAACKATYGFNVNGLVTFGSPRVGMDSFCKIIREIPGYRFVRDGDRVADVPFWPYRHDRGPFVLDSPGMIDHFMPGYSEIVMPMHLTI